MFSLAGTLLSFNLVHVAIVVQRCRDADHDGGVGVGVGAGAGAGGAEHSPEQVGWLMGGVAVAAYFVASDGPAAWRHEHWAPCTRFVLAALCFSACFARVLRATRLAEGRVQQRAAAGAGADGGFRCPCVPWLPCCAVLANSFMVAAMPRGAWTRLTLWSAAGGLVYLLMLRRRAAERGTASPL